MKQILKNTRKIIMPLLTLVAISAPVGAKANSVEINPTNKDITLDMKMSGKVAPRTTFFARNMAALDYDNKTSYFGLFDLMVGIWKGLSAVGEAQVIPGNGIIPRAGFGYFTKLGEYGSFYVAPTILTQAGPNLEICASASYEPLFEKWGLSLYTEDITNVGKDGHNFSIQKLRAGPSFFDGKLSAGVAVDLNEGKEFDWKAGSYARVNF